MLLIDDDEELSALLKAYFIAEGFEFYCALSGDTGLKMFDSGSYNIVILDVMLPERDGFDILREIRSRSSVPVIILTARGEHIDKVVGLEIGADDYVCKPFQTRELSARIGAVLRRSASSEKPDNVVADDVLNVGDLIMNRRSRSVKIGAQSIDLTNTEFILLEYMLSSVGEKISSEQLSIEALERPYTPFDRSLSVHICKLRQKLGLYPCGSERIKTLWGEGFMYVLPE
jgi:two-component system response regulator CpxR